MIRWFSGGLVSVRTAQTEQPQLPQPLSKAPKPILQLTDCSKLGGVVDSVDRSRRGAIVYRADAQEKGASVHK